MPATGDVARSQCPDQAAARRESSLLRCSCRGWWSFLGGARGWGGQCASASAEKSSSSLGSRSPRTWRPERRWRLAIIQLVREPGVWAVWGGANTWDGESSSGHGQPGLGSRSAPQRQRYLSLPSKKRHLWTCRFYLNLKSCEYMFSLNCRLGSWDNAWTLLTQSLKCGICSMFVYHENIISWRILLHLFLFTMCFGFNYYQTL
jgi:hypothetical protein